MHTNKLGGRSWLVLGFAAILGVSSPQAGGQISIPIAPFVSLTISNLVGETYVKYELSEPLPPPRPGKDAADKDIWVFDPYTLETSEFMVRLEGILNPDPSIGYMIAVSDFGAPSTFSVVFATPIVPIGSPNEVEAHVSGSLTDATGDGVDLTLILPSLQEASVAPVPFFPLTGLGVDVGLGASHPAAGPGSLYAYGPYAAGPIAGPGPGPWTALLTATEFGLGGGGDKFEVHGFASINHPSAVIPESGTVLAGGVVLLAVGFRAWRLRGRGHS